jgi:hypothetical protein
MNDLNIIYHGDARLADWGETRSGGKYIKLYLDDDDDDPLLNFRGLDTATLKKSGHNFNVTISQGDIIPAEQPQAKPYGKFASQLYSGGFFLAPNVLQAIGSDDTYRKWIQTQPSAYSGNFSEYINGEGRCIAAHVRRSSNAGTGYKPPYSCIPLTDAEHQLQHQKGESALSPREEWDKAKNKYLIKWAKQELAAFLGYESMGFVPPKTLRKWCLEKDTEQYLPRAYRES